jgi:hypothetical protein
MSRKEQARERATLTALETVDNELERKSWARTALEIINLPQASVDRNAHTEGRFALLAFGEMDA